MVEKASRRFSPSWDRAMSEAVMMVTEAMAHMSVDTCICLSRSRPYTSWATRTMENTPTLTTATACSRAETGVGATMAAGSQEWKGMMPALAKPNTSMTRSTVMAVTESPEPDMTPAAEKSRVPVAW